MAFDCVCIDFKNTHSEKNIKNIKEKFPYAVIIPFISSYFDIINAEIRRSRTKFLWVLTSIVDYQNFDFDFIPEQHEQYQIHTWSLPEQKEGDTFLIPTTYQTSSLKYLRDYKDINYHQTTSLIYENDLIEQRYTLKNNIDDLIKEPLPDASYIKYSDVKTSDTFYPSYWEDLKIYINSATFYIPAIALKQITTQIYDYPRLLKLRENNKKDCFDICFISNNEPFAEKNYEILEKHIQKNNLKNRVYRITNVDGRTTAYKKAAQESQTDYFYAVFAKSMVVDNFLFDYTVDRGKNKRHYIFHSLLEELCLEYGTFNINLYHKELCLNTSEENILDFTLSSQHEIVSTIASKALLAPDKYTAWKNGFREVSKLVYWNKQKPTVENTFRISKWLNADNEWLRIGSQDGKKFVENIHFDYNELIKTYTWDFCRETFKSLYPNETLY